MDNKALIYALELFIKYLRRDIDYVEVYMMAYAQTDPTPIPAFSEAENSIQSAISELESALATLRGNEIQ
jgi:hypothetical protein